MPRAWVNLQCERRSNRPSTYQRTKKMPEFGKNVVCWKREKGKVRAGRRLAIECGRGVGSRSDAGEASGGDQVRAERWQPLRRGWDVDGWSNASEVSTSYSETCEALEAFGDKTCEERPRRGRPMRAPTINAVAPHVHSKAAEKKARANKALTWKYMVGDTRFELVTPTVSR